MSPSGSTPARLQAACARGFADIKPERRQKRLTANHLANGQAPLVSLRSNSGDIELQSSGLALTSHNKE
jgi:hypothetical protein